MSQEPTEKDIEKGLAICSLYHGNHRGIECGISKGIASALAAERASVNRPKCDNDPGSTHYQGCDCHEAAWIKEREELEKELKHKDDIIRVEDKDFDELTQFSGRLWDENKELKESLRREREKSESLAEALDDLLHHGYYYAIENEFHVANADKAREALESYQKDASEQGKK